MKPRFNLEGKNAYTQFKNAEGDISNLCQYEFITGKNRLNFHMVKKCWGEYSVPVNIVEMKWHSGYSSLMAE